jgi:hypothetical protein
MEVDLQSLFGLHVTWCAQLQSLAETPAIPPRIWTRYTRALLVIKDRRHLLVTPCIYCIRMTWCTATVWLICGCSRLHTGQRFSRGHLGSFIAGTEDSRRTLKMWEVWDCTWDWERGKAGCALNSCQRKREPLHCDVNRRVWQLKVSCCMFAVGFGWLKFSRCESWIERDTKYIVAAGFGWLTISRSKIYKRNVMEITNGQTWQNSKNSI